MDEPNVKRNKKSDKAKKNFEKTGGLSSRHIRIQETLQQKKKGSK
jgi:hypothetical protein